MVAVERITQRKNDMPMRNEVTAYGIMKALKGAKAPSIVRDIAILANIDTTSENLQMIKDELYDFADLGFVEVIYDRLQDGSGAVRFEIAGAA